MTPSTRNATKHTKARTRRRLTAQERLARDCRQAQHATEALQQALDDLGLPEDLVTEIGPVTTLTLVANSKMGEMTLSILTAEGHRNWVASCAEIAAAVGERMVERIRHQCQRSCHQVSLSISKTFGYSTENSLVIFIRGGEPWLMGYCWRISFKVLGVLFIAEVSPAFLPSKKAYGIHKFQHFWVRQQYPFVFETIAVLNPIFTSESVTI